MCNKNAGWIGEIRNIAVPGKSANTFVTVVYRITLKGADGEVSFCSLLITCYFPSSSVHLHRYIIFRKSALFGPLVF